MTDVTYPNAISPAIVGARRDGESVVLIVVDDARPPALAVRSEYRMSMGLAGHVWDELGEALGK